MGRKSNQLFNFLCNYFGIDTVLSSFIALICVCFFIDPEIISYQTSCLFMYEYLEYTELVQAGEKRNTERKHDYVKLNFSCN